MTVKELPISGKGGRFELLKQMNACFVFCGNNPQQKWPNKKPYSLCGSEKHHVLLCKSEKVKTDPKTEFHTHVEGAGLALYPVQQAKVRESGDHVTMFCDGGSNTTYITHQAADRIKPKKLKKFTLDVSIMGNVEKTYNTRQYQFTLRTDSGKKSQRYGLWYGQNYWSCN